MGVLGAVGGVATVGPVGEAAARPPEGEAAVGPVGEAAAGPPPAPPPEPSNCPKAVVVKARAAMQAKIVIFFIR